MKKPVSVMLIALSVVALDQITKYLVITYLNPLDSIEISPFLHLVSVRNTGAAFGMFKSFSSSFFISVSVLAITFVIWLLVTGKYNYFGLSLVLGGAIGNLIDRIIYGKVVDFIDFSVGRFHWPAFNVADSSLTVGIIIILLVPLLKK
ncbi:MAG: signal peptidase II [Nitrospirae bacterium RBG_13_39_12]|nr:MAG: signal peptidase II [Nitrospirae bacterium RBG_13_39_12]